MTTCTPCWVLLSSSSLVSLSKNISYENPEQPPGRTAMRNAMPVAFSLARSVWSLVAATSVMVTVVMVRIVRRTVLFANGFRCHSDGTVRVLVWRAGLRIYWVFQWLHRERLASTSARAVGNVLPVVTDPYWVLYDPNLDLTSDMV